MRQEDIIQLAKDAGYLPNHFLLLKDKTSGVVISGKFSKYKQHETSSLRMKGLEFEVEIITDGKFNFDILRSISLVKSAENLDETSST